MIRRSILGVKRQLIDCHLWKSSFPQFDRTIYKLDFFVSHCNETPNCQPNRMYNKGVQTNHVFMPRKSTVSKSTATAPKAPRKTRTRKTATVKTVTSKTVKPAPVAKPVANKVTVTTFQGGKVIAKKTTLKRPGTSKLITPQRYMADIATRWAIHNYEIQELLKDFSKGFEIVRPYHAQVVKMLNN